MSLTIEAPYPAIQTTTILPNPEFGDGISLAAEVDVKRATEGTVRTYISPKNKDKVLELSWRLTREKSLELRAFIEVYFAHKMRITDHMGRVWVVNMVTEGFDFTTFGRGDFNLDSDVAKEMLDIQISFRGQNVIHP